VPFLGWERLHTTFEALRHGAPAETFPERLLRSIDVTCYATSRDLEHIPRSGPVIVVSNHPFGMVETAGIAAMFRQVRPSIRFLANDFVGAVPELRDIIFPIRLSPGSARANAAALRQVVSYLHDGGLLIIFPAGAVSHFDWRERASVDPAWSSTVARILNLTDRGGTRPTVVPMFVPGTNSVAFHLAGMIHPSLRTAFLAHEFFNKRNTQIEFRIGQPVPAARLLAMSSDEERTQYLRWRTYLLADRKPAKPRSPRRISAPVVDAVRSRALALEIADLPSSALLERNGDMAVYLTNAPRIPFILREIGRLREITFRAAGEGTGHPIDLDRFDWYYQHLFVWNARTQEVVGAYRLQCTGDGEDRDQDLYTRTLFQFDNRFVMALGPGIELGRSFIRGEYQKTFTPLALLWKGIGKFVAAHPRYKMLFGPVSISNRYRSASRDLMVAFLEKEAGLMELTHLVCPRHTVRAPQRPASAATSAISLQSSPISNPPTRPSLCCFGSTSVWVEACWGSAWIKRFPTSWTA
jgi:putative hemolysin